jgi:hypothetical protein
VHINLDDSIKIHARVSRSRYGRKARERILETAKALRAQGDEAGGSVWDRVATELDSTDRASQFNLVGRSSRFDCLG